MPDRLARRWKHAADLILRKPPDRRAARTSTRWAPDTVNDFMHAKVVVADDVAFVGSFNLSHSGELNAENVLELKSPELAEQLATFVDEIRARYPLVTVPEDAPVHNHCRVHAEDGPLAGLGRHGLRLADGMCPHQLHWGKLALVVFLVAGGRDVEGKPELLEDRPSLRRGRREKKRRGHRLRARQISSDGH